MQEYGTHQQQPAPGRSWYTSEESLAWSAVHSDLIVDQQDLFADGWDEAFDYVLDTGLSTGEALEDYMAGAAPDADWANPVTDSLKQAIGLVQEFGDTRDELFFGGRTAAMTGQLYKQVISQGVGTLYNHQEVIVNNTNQFHGFFNEETTASKIHAAIEAVIAGNGISGVKNAIRS